MTATQVIAEVKMPGAVDAFIAGRHHRASAGGGPVCFVSLLFSLAGVLPLRAQTAGTLDPSFDPNVTGSIAALAVQPDGKIVIGGLFTQVGGQPRANLARLNPDGTVESLSSFKIGSGANGQVSCIAVQPDGKIIIGGAFSMLDGQHHRNIARLNPDGSAETSATFNMGNGPYPAGPFAGVNCLVLQPDGKILIGGAFYELNGQPQGGIARLLPDGNMESTATFNPGTGFAPATSNDNVLCMALQSNGKILVGGSFTGVNGQPRSNLARLNPDGTVESRSTFDPGTGPNGNVRLLAHQLDGTILIGGTISSVNSQSAGAVAKLSSNGSLISGLEYAQQSRLGGYALGMALQADGKVLVAGSYLLTRLFPDGRRDVFGTNEEVRTDNDILSVAIQADGKILIAGQFALVDYHLPVRQPRSSIARLLNDPAPQAVTVTSRERVEWTRGGTAPEVEQVTFELSTDGGASWTPQGPGVRMAGGWERTGLVLPAAGTIRARGCSLCGSSGSSGMVEMVAPFSRVTPEISIQQAEGVELVSGTGAVDFGPVVVDSDISRTFTIRNTWTGELSGLSVEKAPGGTPADFTITPPVSPALAPGGSMTFTVTLHPAAAGTRSALLRVASNDEDENPFEINLTGTGTLPTPLQSWRTLYFGSPYDTGADLNDADGDGMVNLMEFGAGSDPLVRTLPVGQLVKKGGTLEFTYNRPKAALEDLRYDLEASVTISGTWSSASQAEFIQSDDGITQQVKATYPAGMTGKRFVRLRVTRR